MVQPTMVQQTTAQPMTEEHFCENCDTNSEDGDHYCMTCGRRTNGDAKLTTKSCLKCNKNPENPEDLDTETFDKEIYCPRCRARVTELYVQLDLHGKDIQIGI